MFRSLTRATAAAPATASVVSVQARSFAIKQAKGAGAGKAAAAAELVRNPVGGKHSLLEVLHRKRIMHWADARKRHPEMPAEVPADIHLHPAQWPSAAYVSGMRVYRKHWTRYAEPCYTVITRVVDNENTSKVWGVETFRGVTAATETRLSNTRKTDWNVLPADVPVAEAWKLAMQSPTSVVALPLTPLYAKEEAPKEE